MRLPLLVLLALPLPAFAAENALSIGPCAAQPARGAELRRNAQPTVGAEPNRRFHPATNVEGRPDHGSRGRSPDAHPPGDVRPDRPAADARGGRRVRRRSRRRCLREGRRSTAGPPRYGERWGRHWLDVVRYAETGGLRVRPPIARGPGGTAITSSSRFNGDKPYDRFVLEQIAGDEIGPDEPGTARRGRASIGSARCGGTPAIKTARSDRNEVLTELTDVIGGRVPRPDGRLRPLPRSQVRHDPAEGLLPVPGVPRRDPGARHRPRQCRRAGRMEDTHREDQGRDSEAPESSSRTRPIRPIKDKIAELQRSLPEPLPTISTVQNVASERTPIHVLKRGDLGKQGPLVGPRPLSVLLPDEMPELPADVADPRTRLARWLVDSGPSADAARAGQPGLAVPLRPRAGRDGQRLRHQRRDAEPSGIARLAGQRVPIEHGWRIKPIHRLILLSSTYRQSVVARDAAQEPTARSGQSRCSGSFPRRRLSAEEIRDAMLAVSGRLNRKAGGPSVMLPVESDLVQLAVRPVAVARYR